MARKQEFSKPIEGSFYSQNQNALLLVAYLRHWIKVMDLMPSAEIGRKDPKYSIGIRGLIIKGWGISSLSNWTYEMVDDWIPIVKILDTCKIIELRPSSYLPINNQPECYNVVIPNIVNLENAERLLRDRI